MNPKNADGPLPHFHPSSVPDSPRRLLPRRPARHAVGGRESGTERGAGGERHEKTALTPLTPLTPCEAHSFADSGMSAAPPLRQGGDAARGTAAPARRRR